MLKIVLVAVLATAFAAPVEAQDFRILRKRPPVAQLTSFDVTETRKFQERAKAEIQIIRLSCEEHMISEYDQEAINTCIRRGIREYFLNYTSLSASLTAKLEEEAPPL